MLEGTIPLLDKQSYRLRTILEHTYEVLDGTNVKVGSQHGVKDHNYVVYGVIGIVVKVSISELAASFQATDAMLANQC